MSAAVLVTVVLANILWGWIAPHVLPAQEPLRVVVVSTERAQEVASNH